MLAPGAGHTVPEERPEEFNRLVAEFDLREPSAHRVTTGGLSGVRAARRSAAFLLLVCCGHRFVGMRPFLVIG